MKLKRPYLILNNIQYINLIQHKLEIYIKTQKPCIITEIIQISNYVIDSYKASYMRSELK